MGGSLALAFKEREAAREVCAWDVSPEAMKTAGEMGVAHRMASTADDAARGAEFVFLATPLGDMAVAAGEAAPGIGAGAVVSDLGSAKVSVVAAIEGALPEGAHFVGGHPMAGSEQSGVRFARSDLFRDRYYILTPTERTDPDAYSSLHALLASIGARVISMDPESHDRAMATISHVPHLLSLLLMEMAAREQERMRSIYTVAAGGFRDMTRIAASSPDIWLDIASQNREFIVSGLRQYADSVNGLIDLIERDDRDSLAGMFAHAREAREELSRKAGVEMADLFELSMPVRDRPGAISSIATTLGSIGINIEDISIAHPMEGETGILTLMVQGEQNAREGAAHLESAGYRVSLGKA